jgi:hypothetical protein
MGTRGTSNNGERERESGIDEEEGAGVVIRVVIRIGGGDNGDSRKKMRNEPQYF